MTNNPDDLSAKLSIEPDKSSFAQSNREIDKLIAGIDDLTKETEQLDRAQKKTTDGANKQRKAYRDLAAEAKKAADEARKLRQAQVDRTSNAFGRTSTGVGSLASVASGVAGGAAGEGLRLAGDVAGAAEQIPALVSGIASLGPVALVAGAASVGLALAIGQTIDQQNKLREATQARLDVEQNVLRLIVTGTRDQLEARRKQLQQEYEVQSTTAERLNAQFQEQLAALDTFDRARLQVGLAYSEIKTLGDNAEAASKQADSAWQELKLLEEQLSANATAANDAAEAEKKLAEQRQAFIDRTVDTIVRTQLQGESLTSETLKKRLDALANEKAILEQVIAESNISQAALDKYKSRLQDINAETSVLIYTVQPLIEAREKEAKAVELVKKSITDTISAATKTLSLLSERSGEINKVNEDLRNELGQIDAERNKARVDAEREASKGRLEAEREREQALRENFAEATEARLKAEEDYHKQVQAIQRRFNRESSDAIAERDVLAFIQARRSRNDELRDAKEARDEQLRDINAQLSKQNQLVAQRYNEQIAAVNERLIEQNRIANERYAEQVRAANDAAQRELQTIRAKYAQELQVIQQGAAASISAAGSFWNGMIGLATNALRAVQSSAQSTTTNPLLKIFGFAGGGVAPANMPVAVNERGRESGLGASGRLTMFSEPTRVFTKQQTDRMLAGQGGGGLNIPININGAGMGARQITDIVDQRVYKTLIEAGYDQ